MTITEYISQDFEGLEMSLIIQYKPNPFVPVKIYGIIYFCSHRLSQCCEVVHIFLPMCTLIKCSPNLNLYCTKGYNVQIGTQFTGETN